MMIDATHRTRMLCAIDTRAHDQTILVVALSMSLGCRTGEIVSDNQALDDGRQWLDPRAIPAPSAISGSTCYFRRAKS